ncbi:MAG: phage holin family protein [Parasutterella sp.]
MKQTTWEDFMTAIAMITVILIIVCSISGAAMPYEREKMFKFIRYLVEVITSAAAGFIVFLLLRVTDIPGEWIAAFSGISLISELGL